MTPSVPSSTSMAPPASPNRWGNGELNARGSLLENAGDMSSRSRVFRRMLEIAERQGPAYTVLHRSAQFYGKRKDIGWKWSPTFAMDFSADNLRMPGK